MRKRKGKRAGRREKRKSILLLLPLLLGHVGPEHDHGLVAVRFFWSFFGVERKKKRGGEFFFFCFVSSRDAAAAGSLVFAQFAFSSQRAGRNFPRALPSIRARKLRSLRQVPPPIGRSKKGGGEEEREQAAFFPSCSFRRLSFPRRPDVETREKEKRGRKIASREQKKRKRRPPW